VSVQIAGVVPYILSIHKDSSCLAGRLLLELNSLEFKRIKLSQESTKKLQQFKSRTGLTPNIACRLVLGISIAENNMPSLELFTEESGQEINRYTLFGEIELACPQP